MENWKEKLSIISLVIFCFFALKWFGVWHAIYSYFSGVCVKSHIEQQIKLPPNVVVGGGKYGGGIGVPIGNGRIVNVTVCDEYSYPD